MNRVEYTLDDVWNAIYYVYPTYKVARDAGAYMNPPMAVRDTLLEYFIRREHGIEQETAHGDVLWSAHNDLHNTGSFNYEI